MARPGSRSSWPLLFLLSLLLIPDAFGQCQRSRAARATTSKSSSGPSSPRRSPTDAADIPLPSLSTASGPPTPEAEITTPSEPPQAVLPTITLLPLPSTVEPPESQPAVSPDSSVSIDIAAVRATLLDGIYSKPRSWEFAVAAEALVELEMPALSVLNAASFPPAPDPSIASHEVFRLAEFALQYGGQTRILWGGGSSGDATSVGPMILLANWTLPDDPRFVTASRRLKSHLDWFFSDVPTAENGAKSHRMEHVELWADFIYMAPPFIAYYGALNNSLYLLRQGHFQCMQYRDILKGAGTGLWKHTQAEPPDAGYNDARYWATGNAWAAAGMLRVRETLRRSSHASELTGEVSDLTTWIREILDECKKYQVDGFLRNVISDGRTHTDSSGTALLAAVAFRLMSIDAHTDYLAFANKALAAVKAKIDGSGVLGGVVDPLHFQAQLPAGSVSPEGQAFVLLLVAAYSDFVANTAF